MFSRSAKFYATIAVTAIVCAFLLVFAFNVNQPSPNPVIKAPESLGKPKHSVIGKSVEWRDIDAYTFGSSTRQLLFVGGIHGGYEWNSSLLAYTLMDYLETNPGILPDNLAITIIPSANPDGLYKVIGKEGRFAFSDVSTTTDQSLARFNADKVDLNRNFDCKWQPKSTWKSKVVSAGASAFSEPESRTIENFVSEYRPLAGIFWHSMSNAVYASECKEGILPQTIEIMDAYAGASGYPAVKSFSSYPVTGDAEGWLASIGIPAITVELKTHDTIEWERNLAGFKALLAYYAK
jgi:hypothetical protein